MSDWQFLVEEWCIFKNKTFLFASNNLWLILSIYIFDDIYIFNMVIKIFKLLCLNFVSYNFLISFW